MKKVLLTATAFALFSAGAMAQSNLGLSKPTRKAITPTSGADASPKQYVRCATKAPDAEWDKAFNKAVAEWTAAHTDAVTGKVALTSYTIPVIVHIIHGGQAVGTYPNLSQAQINSQIQVLNEDYGGVGYQPTAYVQTYFNTYASTTSNSVAAASINSSGGIAIANCGITFCMATKDPSGNTLTEPGIDRVSYVTKGWSNPTSFTSSSTFQNYVDGTVKPGTIWDINKYLNMWVTDENSSVGLLGYATFPAGTGLSGLSAPYGSTTTDGFWAYAKAFGSKHIYASGTYDATYYLGRTCSHEIGHYLGLRHIWGDGTCATDYCNDTPPSSAANYNCGTYPYQAGTCTGSPSNSPNGIMWMNIMDYSPDNCMYMFTTDQANRIQTCMANGTYRKNLTSYAATECAAGTSTVAPTAAFTPPSNVCVGVATAFSDASTGSPTSWTWSVTPTTATITTATSQNPTITFGAASSYTVTLTATNANGSNSVSHPVTVTSCTTSSCDTLSNILASDTLTLYTLTTGYLTGSGSVTSGTVTYTVKSIGEVYSASSFPTNVTQVKGAMLIAYHETASNIGTKGTGSMTLKMTNTGTDGGGAMVPGTTTSASVSVSLPSIVASPDVAGVDYAGNQMYDYTGYMKAYPVMFSSPVTMPTTFGLTLSIPTASGDTIVLWSNTGNSGDNPTGCVQLKPSTSTTLTWYNINTGFGVPVSMGLVPIVCPASTGIENNELGSNITLFPNPSKGVFNIAVTMPQASNLNFTIINTLGQVVYTRSENNITNTVLSCDLSSLARGVYYANITDGSGNRTIKKIVIE